MLEPGSGRGEFLLNFKELGLDVYGIDISPEAANFENGLDIKICDVENEKFPFPDNTFDIIYTKSFIEHLLSRENFLEEAYRVLKPNDIFLTLTPDWQGNYKIFFDDMTHRTPFINVALEDTYEIFRFKEVNDFKFRQLPIVWKYPLLNYFCSFITPFISVRTKNKFLRWLRKLMLLQ